MSRIPFRLNLDTRIFGPVAGFTVGFIVLAMTGCGSSPTDDAELGDPLMAPIPKAPAEGKAYSYRAANASPMVVFEWRHGMPTAQIPSPHQADRIIICVYDAQRGECESGTREGVPAPIWFEVSAEDPKVNRAPIKHAWNPFVRGPDIHFGYEFRASLRLRPEYGDRGLLWQVGACASGTCRMSDPRAIQIGRPVEAGGIVVPKVWSG